MDDWKEEIIKNKLGGKREWTDSERRELTLQLDQELEEEMKNRKKADPTEQWTESNWKEKMAEHPIFAPYLQEGTDVIAPISDLGEGLAQLKYDPEHNTLQEVAQNYKEEGVFYFKLKKYRISIKSFSEGIKQKSIDKQLNAQLFNNRAAAHFHLGNHRSCINDCKASIEMDPMYIKPIIRAIDSCIKLENYDDATTWADKGLQLDASNKTILEKRTSAFTLKKEKSRDERKKLKEQQAKLKNESHLLTTIVSRNYNIVSEKQDEELSMEDIQPIHPQCQANTVHMDDDGNLVWPVIFLYPEYTQSDVILEVGENTTLADHLNTMFGAYNEKAPWDEKQEYVIDNLQIFYECTVSGITILVEVEMTRSLLNICSDKRYKIRAGTPSFLVLAKSSKFVKSFIEKYI